MEDSIVEIPENLKCIICLKENLSNEILSSTNCNHIFCNKCLKQWLLSKNINCPICRKNVKNNYDAPDSEKGTTEDGILEIVYNSTNYFETGTMRIVPKEKMFLVFPSYLLHMVYPFISDKTRVSASFNFRVSSDLQQINYGER